MGIYGGWRSVRALWPVLLVAGGSFALAQFVASNYLDYSLTDVLAALVSLIVTLAVPAGVAPAGDPEFAIQRPLAVPVAPASRGRIAGWQGWIPWMIVSAVVIAWTHFKIAAIGSRRSTGRACTTRCSSRSTTRPMPPTGCSSRSAREPRSCWPPSSPPPGAASARAASCEPSSRPGGRAGIAILTVALIVGLAYLMNYSGMNYTLGLGVASAGIFLSDAVGVPRLGGGVPVGQRHLGQRAVRQSAGGRGAISST